MELIETLKQLHTRLPEFGFEEDVSKKLEEYLLFLLSPTSYYLCLDKKYFLLLYLNLLNILQFHHL